MGYQCVIELNGIQDYLQGATLVWGGLSESFAVAKGQRVRKAVTISAGPTPFVPAELSARLQLALKGRPTAAWQPQDVDALAAEVANNYSTEPCVVGWTPDNWESSLTLQGSNTVKHRLTLVILHARPRLGPAQPVQRPKPSPAASP